MAYFHSPFFLAVPKAIRNQVAMKLSLFHLNATISLKMREADVCDGFVFCLHFYIISLKRVQTKQTGAGLGGGFASKLPAGGVFITHVLLHTKLGKY